jgi:hypothetical protein
MTMTRQIWTGRAPAANAEGSFGEPGMVRDHHAVNCECRRCRRLWAAELRRRRKRIQRDLTRDGG